MAYKYEVFISYRHESLSRDWIHKWFLQTFKDHFESLFQKEQGIIFIDTSEILSGTHWESKIRDALLHSKLMISFWTPKYFSPDSYGLKELAFIDYRQKRLNLGVEKSLVIPIRLRGEYTSTSYLQYINFEPHLSIPRGKPPRSLEKEIKKLANEVFERLAHVPEWQDDLASEHWITEAESHIPVVKSICNIKPWACPSIT
ncbi:hypothetical protein FHS57_005089 [Runella defluvii]|uniref:TIR domain-containing protein n=1 Tax=Runella defluvii TaxID=370973 RepID=A0A7W5ZP80_9BACT|nr:toll/interleukin-1 receptor domain-containing protein [Runella defluvii]MBB3841068.1 hypothetical protein [Runella defluvii]